MPTPVENTDVIEACVVIKMSIYQLFFSKNKHLSTISITVVDLQTSSLPLIYQTQFSDFNLNIGYNILSQHWMEKKLTANTFRYLCLSFTYILNFGDFFSVCFVFSYYFYSKFWGFFSVCFVFLINLF